MPPKKKLSKKERARLEAEQAELLRIEMEKEKQRKLEEERQRRQIEREQAKRRLQQEIAENKQRRAQLKNSMIFFDAIKRTINEILNKIHEQSDWDKYMRCNGLPNANIPSDLRKYMHQWKSDIEQRNRESRNWLLRTDERTLLTHDENVENLTRENLRKQQGNLGDIYAVRMKEVLGILNELDETLIDKSKPPHTLADLKRLKTEIRIFLKEYLDEFTYKLLSYIERDMDIDRPGVSKHIYSSDVFKSHVWAFAKDAQISVNPKARIGDQNQHNEISFPIMDMEISLPPTVKLPCSAIRGLWLSYDHLSDRCNSFELKRPRPDTFNILMQTKKEWRKRKEILQSMLEDCAKDSSPSGYSNLDSAGASGSQKVPERSNDVDKLYTEYEDELNKARRHAIGPESFNLTETDVNLRKYRIIGGVYCVDYLETPQQDKKLNARSFIRTILTADYLMHKNFYQTYKPPPPVQPGVRRLPEEIEAEMRMMEAALEKLALVTVQLPDSVIWFEPPIVCRWETQMETIESQFAETSQPPTTATPTEITPRSTTTNLSPLKSSPRFTSKMRKRSSQKTVTAPAIREITDFDMYNIPSNIDIYGLIKDFVVPRLPQGFCARLEISKNSSMEKKPKQQQRIVLFARHKSINTARPTELKNFSDTAENEENYTKWHVPPISEDFLEYDEPHEFFPHVEVEKLLKFKNTSKEKLMLRRNTESPKKCLILKNTVEEQNEKLEKKDKLEKTGQSFSQSSENSSRRSSEEKHSKQTIKRNSYMFSELLEDLDRLCELQMPLKKQEQALKKISAQLASTPASSIGSNGATTKEQESNLVATEVIPPAFSYYSGISFMRDLEATKSDSTKHKNNADNDNDESSSDWDDAYDDDEDYYYSYNVDDGNDAEAAASALNDYLSKQSQSESTSGSNTDGKTKKAHMEALKQGKWSIRDVHDTKFNEDKLSIQFRTGRLGIFGFALNRYSNMPYQTWEVKPDFKSTTARHNAAHLNNRNLHLDECCVEQPLQSHNRIHFHIHIHACMGVIIQRLSFECTKCLLIITIATATATATASPGTILFSFTASIVSLDMTITSAGYCVNNFQGGGTEAINEMIGKTYSLQQLKDILICSAVDIFPEEDAFCYTEGSCEKNYVMEMHLYACISTLAQSHNFSWSRWNLLAGSRTVILLIRELLEGKKVPNHSTLWVTPLKTAIIECTEVSASFNAVGIPGMEYYADLYQLSQVHAQPSSLEKQRTMDPVLRENVARILMAIRPLSFC